jgi:site-specific recombinase XerD
VGTEITSNVFLTVDELEILSKLDLTDSPHLDRSRDMFLIGAWSGLRYSDWHRVASDLIVDGVLTIRANKTDEICQIPIHKTIHEILSKYDGTLPPMLSNQKMNDNLKKICEKAKFDTVSEKVITKGGKKSNTPEKLAKHQQVTTHTARRSFCTNAILQGASPYAVMQISGHKTLDSFDRYIKMTKILAVDNLKKIPMFQ